MAEIDVAMHARTHISHDFPVRGIYTQCGYKRPLATHVRFNRMNGAIAFPEDAVPVTTLGQHLTLTGINTII